MCGGVCVVCVWWCVWCAGRRSEGNVVYGWECEVWYVWDVKMQGEKGVRLEGVVDLYENRQRFFSESKCAFYYA